MSTLSTQEQFQEHSEQEHMCFDLLKLLAALCSTRPSAGADQVAGSNNVTKHPRRKSPSSPASPFENQYHSVCTILSLPEARPIFTTHILGSDRLHIMTAWFNGIITMIKLFPSSEELFTSLPDSVTMKYCDLYRVFVRFVAVLKTILNVEPIDNELRTIIVTFITNFENEILSMCSIIKTKKIRRRVGPMNKSEPKPEPESEKKENIETGNESKSESKKDTPSVPAPSPMPRRSTRLSNKSKM
jgi:hypothetical protein